VRSEGSRLSTAGGGQSKQVSDRTQLVRDWGLSVDTKSLLSMCRGQKTLKSQKTKWWQKPLVTTTFNTDLTKGA